MLQSTTSIIRMGADRAVALARRSTEHLDSSPPPDALQLLWQRRRALSIIVAACLVAAVVYLSVAPATYTAVSRLQVVQGLPNTEAGGGPESAEARAKNFINTQCQLISSGAVLDSVAARPEVRQMRTFAGAADLLTALKDRLSVEPGQKDDLITLSLDSPDAQEAAKVVNLVVESYVAHQRSRTGAMAEDLLRIVQREKEQRQAELSRLRQAMLKYKKDNAALSFVDERSNIVLQRLAQLSEAATTAEVHRMRAEGAYNAAKRISANPSLAPGLALSDPAPALSIGDLDNNRAYSEMREELMKAEVAYAAAQRQLGVGHPRLAALEQVSDSIRSRLATVSVDALHQALETARAREATLVDAVKEEKARALAMNSVTAEFAVLEADVQHAQKVVEELDTRITQLRLAQEGGGLSIDVVDRPSAGGPPTAPRKSIVLAGAGLAGVLLGACYAFLCGLNDVRLHSGEEIGSFLRLPILCGVPHLGGRGKRGARRRALIAGLDPSSPAAEVYRMIRTAIQFGPRLKTLLITSPNQGEGKSTVACNLAVVLAQSGERTLLVDADLRNPSVDGLLTVDNRIGLSSVLRGEAGLGESIHRTKLERLHVLPAGPVPLNPSELLNNQRFQDMLRRLSRHYDRIIFDSPPARLADPLILAAACDATVLVLRAGRSTRPSCAAAQGALASVGARFLGVIANDVRSQPTHGYYGSWPANRIDGRSGFADLGVPRQESVPGEPESNSGFTAHQMKAEASAREEAVGFGEMSPPSNAIEKRFGDGDNGHAETRATSDSELVATPAIRSGA